MSVRSPGYGKPGTAGAQGPQGPQGVPGSAGANGTNGTNGANGIVPVYNSTGLIASPKMWVGTATTNSSGQWTANWSSAGFASVLSVQPNAISSALTGAGAVSTTMTAPTLTGCSGACFIPNAISLLGLLPLQSAGAGLTIQLIVMGT